MNPNFKRLIDEHFDYTEVSGGKEIKLSGECPFCHEDRYDLRLYINTETGRGYCHHCGRGFTPVSFVAAFMDCSAARAKSFLYGGKAACPFKKHEKGAAGSAIWFPKITSLNKQAIAYLKSRNINDGLIRHFQLAFCDTDTAYNDKIYYTSNRLIIPVKDLNGKIISWQGRDITGKSFAKYLFPPGFKGAEYVYNIDAIEPESYIIICEGVFDVFGWWQAGFKNTVATFGKKISKHQLALIKSKRPKVIYIAWDSDANWQKYDFCEKLTDFCPVKIIDLNNKDADELSPAELLRAFKTARPNDWSAKIFSLLAV